MRRETKPIKALLLRTFLPAVLLVATLLAVFAYNWHYATIIEGFDRKLIATSAMTGAMIDPEDHETLIANAIAGVDAEEAEQAPEYQRNVMPIQRILSELKLTYLYSQAIGGTQDIVYVLDGSVGEEHSPIGSEDELSDQTLEGIRTAESGGDIFVSPIEYQEQWGLLKTAVAPIYDRDGQANSTAGADVDISLILVATQNALFASTLIGICSILACLLIALVIVRKVADPIETLKDMALRIAAGEARPLGPAQGPREVSELSDALTKMTADSAASTAKRVRSAEQDDQNANIALLSQGRQRIEGSCLHLLDHDGARIFWRPIGSENIEALLANQSMVLLAAKLTEEPELAEHWRALADTDHGICLAINQQAGTIELVGETSASIVRGTRELPLQPGSPEIFDPSKDQILTGRGPAFRISVAQLSDGTQP